MTLVDDAPKLKSLLLVNKSFGIAVVCYGLILDSAGPKFNPASDDAMFEVYYELCGTLGLYVKSTYFFS